MGVAWDHRSPADGGLLAPFGTQCWRSAMSLVRWPHRHRNHQCGFGNVGSEWRIQLFLRLTVSEIGAGDAECGSRNLYTAATRRASTLRPATGIRHMRASSLAVRVARWHRQPNGNVDRQQRMRAPKKTAGRSSPVMQGGSQNRPFGELRTQLPHQWQASFAGRFNGWSSGFSRRITQRHPRGNSDCHRVLVISP